MMNRRWIISGNEAGIDAHRRAAAEPEATVADLVAGLVAVRRPVHLHGETGTGKSYTARRVHEASGRGHLQFLEFHCQAASRLDVTEMLVGLILDGPAMGLGTIHIESIESLPRPAQSGLLRVLRSLDDEPAGSCPALVVSGSRPLWEAVEEGRFLPELHGRLGALEVHLQPLRDRPGRIETLATSFLSELTRSKPGSPTGIAFEAVEALRNFPWPGNLRQLRNAVEHALIFAEGDSIRVRDLPAGIVRFGEVSRRIRATSWN